MREEIKDHKTEELLLYITSKLADCPSFGSVLLNKVLYYIDNINYLKYGKPISGFKYVKQKLGPTPAPALFVPFREKMIAEHKLEMREVERFGKIQKRLVPKKGYQIDIFSAKEIELMDGVIESCSKFNANEISDFSHDEIGWKFANLMEELPFNTYLLTEAELDEDDITWANKKISQYSLSNN